MRRNKRASQHSDQEDAAEDASAVQKRRRVDHDADINQLFDGAKPQRNFDDQQKRLVFKMVNALKDT